MKRVSRKEAHTPRARIGTGQMGEDVNPVLKFQVAHQENQSKKAPPNKSQKKGHVDSKG